MQKGDVVQTLEPMHHVKIQASYKVTHPKQIRSCRQERQGIEAMDYNINICSGFSIVILEGLTTDEEEIITWF